MKKIFTKKYSEILELFCVSSHKGYTQEEIDAVKHDFGDIPFALELFYLNYAKSSELMGLQDELILPNRYKALINDEYIIFFNENQGVWQAGVKKSDSMCINPPVYVYMDGGEWILSSNSVSDFLVAMFGYQASICLKYSPEDFFFISLDEWKTVKSRFTKREEGLKNLFNCDVELYGDNNNGRIAIMSHEGEDIQMNYAANTKGEYLRMKALLSDIGEVI